MKKRSTKYIIVIHGDGENFYLDEFDGESYEFSKDRFHAWSFDTIGQARERLALVHASGERHAEIEKK